MNNDPRYIHETQLADIMNMAKAVKDFASDKDRVKRFIGSNKGKKLASPMANSTSIAKASSNLTLVFPVIASKSVTVQNASMVCKALEKNFVSMLQALFASWQIVDEKDVGNFNDYINSIHKNISSKVADLDDVFAMLNSATEDNEERLTLNEANMIKSDMRNINYYLPSEINETALTNYSINEAAANPTVSMKNFNGENITKTAGSKDTSINANVMNADYKKANDLMPTSMVVNFSIAVRDDKGNITSTVPYTSAICAVKAKLYPIASDDIIKHLTDKTTERNWITNFFRATTREISFFKDFLLAIDKAKIDALSMSDRNRTTDKMWKVLERRALLSKSHNLIKSANAGSVAAITSLIISQDEVEYMKKYYNIDLERTSVVAGLFSSLNLISICIVDENLEVAKFIFDQDEPTWETMSFNQLERESSDGSYKKIVNLMTKVSK